MKDLLEYPKSLAGKPGNVTGARCDNVGTSFSVIPRENRVVLRGAVKACFRCDFLTRNGGPCPGILCTDPEALPACYANIATDLFGSNSRRLQVLEDHVA